MIRVLVFLLAVTTLAQAAGAPAFPYHRYADIPDDVLIGPTCPDGDVMMGRSGETFRILTMGDRDIFIHVTDGQADYIYFTQGTAEDGVIHVLHVYTADEVKAHYPAGPCSYFHEVSA